MPSKDCTSSTVLDIVDKKVNFLAQNGQNGVKLYHKDLATLNFEAPRSLSSCLQTLPHGSRRVALARIIAPLQAFQHLLRVWIATTMEGILLKLAKKSKIKSIFGVFQYISGLGPILHFTFALASISFQAWKDKISCTDANDSSFSSKFVEDYCGSKLSDEVGKSLSHFK